MKYPLKLRGIALSTLLLSSLASPVFADAASTTGVAQSLAHPAAVQLTAAAAQPVQGIPAGVRVPDVLSLVQRYAPDTVQEWTDVLSRYGKTARIQLVNPGLLSQASTLILTDAGTAAAVHVTASGSLTAALSSAADSAPLGSLENLPVKLTDVIQVSGWDVSQILSAVPAASISAATLNTVSAPDSISAVKLSGSVTMAAAGALLPLTDDNGLLEAESALSAAVDHKDASAIKLALAELLKEYKVLVNNLEAAK